MDRGVQVLGTGREVNWRAVLAVADGTGWRSHSDALAPMPTWLLWIHAGYTSVSYCKHRHQLSPYKQGVAGATSACGSRGPSGGEPGIAHHTNAPVAQEAGGASVPVRPWGSHQRRPAGASQVPRRPSAAAVPPGSSPAVSAHHYM